MRFLCKRTKNNESKESKVRVENFLKKKLKLILPKYIIKKKKRERRKKKKKGRNLQSF